MPSVDVGGRWSDDEQECYRCFRFEPCLSCHACGRRACKRRPSLPGGTACAGLLYPTGAETNNAGNAAPGNKARRPAQPDRKETPKWVSQQQAFIDAHWCCSGQCFERAFGANLRRGAGRKARGGVKLLLANVTGLSSCRLNVWWALARHDADVFVLTGVRKGEMATAGAYPGYELFGFDYSNVLIFAKESLRAQQLFFLQPLPKPGVIRYEHLFPTNGEHDPLIRTNSAHENGHAFVGIQLCNGLTVMGVYYALDNGQAEFVSNLQHTLLWNECDIAMMSADRRRYERFKLDATRLLVVGDFNLDYMNDVDRALCDRKLTAEHGCNLQQVVDEATFEDSEYKICTDHLWVGDKVEVLTVGVDDPVNPTPRAHKLVTAVVRSSGPGSRKASLTSRASLPVKGRSQSSSSVHSCHRHRRMSLATPAILRWGLQEQEERRPRFHIDDDRPIHCFMCHAQVSDACDACVKGSTTKLNASLDENELREMRKSSHGEQDENDNNDSKASVLVVCAGCRSKLKLAAERVPQLEARIDVLELNQLVLLKLLHGRHSSLSAAEPAAPPGHLQLCVPGVPPAPPCTSRWSTDDRPKERDDDDRVFTSASSDDANGRLSASTVSQPSPLTSF